MGTAAEFSRAPLRFSGGSPSGLYFVFWQRLAETFEFESAHWDAGGFVADQQPRCVADENKRGGGLPPSSFTAIARTAEAGGGLPPLSALGVSGGAGRCS